MHNLIPLLLGSFFSIIVCEPLVLSEITVNWPGNISIDKIAPWLTTFKMFIKDESSISIKLAPTENEDSQIVIVEMGSLPSLYISRAGSNEIESITTTSRIKLDKGDQIALVLPGLDPSSAIIPLVNPTNFLGDIMTLMTMNSKNVPRGVFTAKVVDREDARNLFDFYHVHGQASPKDKPNK